ncbi:peroxidase 60-like [Typha latifolia]|uniref:peroxidase 60-like n=1 Tax=Typha latifolia TaxID=4733 RepID=UPI003C2CC6FB
MKNPTLFAAAVALALLSLAVVETDAAALQVGYYRGKCGKKDVEAIIRGVVAARFRQDPTLVAALLQLQFYDCFVNGCDASILLDGPSCEKNAAPNLSARGYDLIDEVKVAVESACPGVVSCADIIVTATRDAIVLAGGSPYDVRTGRRDGRISLAKNVNLPAPSISVPEAIGVFKKKGLSANDMVILLGGHTVGVTHCSSFADRLYDYNKTGKSDQKMDQSFATTMKAKCPKNGKTNNKVNFKQNSLNSYALDNNYYKQVVAKKGILHIDQRLAFDPATTAMVASLANGSDFPRRFSDAMIKLGAIQVLTGTQGEIRRSCRRTN